MSTKTKAPLLADALEAQATWVPSGPASVIHRSAAELRRLHHNNQVLTNALWKACGDDEGVVNDTIASEGELK